ncbi:MAG: alpha/beta fold hydrolase [Gammaproteobacteria bacterium]
MTAEYKPGKHADHQTVNVRHLAYVCHCWGDAAARPVFLLHGWADTGMSFQFLADAMSEEWYLIAPDWRGFGDTERSSGGYWFPDYLADLDVLVDHYSPRHPVRLVGHSLGGNAACLYAGVRPGRISHLVSLDAFGLRDTRPSEAPARYVRWLDECRGTQAFTLHDDLNPVIARIRRLAPHLNRERARFIARHWSRTTADGKWVVKVDAAHKRVNPVLYRREEARSCWRRITARVLLILGDESDFYKRYREEGGRDECQSCFRDFSELVLEGSDHMLHLDQPEKMARMLDDFLRK